METQWQMMLLNTLRQNDSSNNRTEARNHQIVMFYDFIICVAMNRMYAFETPPN